MSEQIIDPTTGLGMDLSSLSDYVPVTPGASLLANGTCRAICVTVAGTVNLTTPSGTDRDGVPCVVGINPYAASKIRSGGTATGIFAGY